MHKLKAMLLEFGGREGGPGSTKVMRAFLAKKKATSHELKSHGDEVRLHGNRIAWHGPEGQIMTSHCGWNTQTTRRHLNTLAGLVGGKRFHTKDHQLYHGGIPIDSREHVDIHRGVWGAQPLGHQGTMPLPGGKLKNESLEEGRGFNVGDKVKTTMGASQRGTVIKPFHWKESTDGTYSPPGPGYHAVRWANGTKGYMHGTHLATDDGWHHWAFKGEQGQLHGLRGKLNNEDMEIDEGDVVPFPKGGRNTPKVSQKHTVGKVHKFPEPKTADQRIAHWLQVLRGKEHDRRFLGLPLPPKLDEMAVDGGKLIGEAAPPGEWGEWARRMVTHHDMKPGIAYGLAWKNHKAGKEPPKVRSKLQKTDKIGGEIKAPPKKKYEAALKANRKGGMIKAEPHRPGKVAPKDAIKPAPVAKKLPKGDYMKPLNAAVEGRKAAAKNEAARRKMKQRKRVNPALDEYPDKKLDWKDGAAATGYTAAGAAAGAATGVAIGFNPIAGAVIGGGHYLAKKALQLWKNRRG